MCEGAAGARAAHGDEPVRHRGSTPPLLSPTPHSHTPLPSHGSVPPALYVRARSHRQQSGAVLDRPTAVLLTHASACRRAPDRRLTFEGCRRAAHQNTNTARAR